MRYIFISFLLLASVSALGQTQVNVTQLKGATALTPAGDQAITQPMGTTLNVNSLNKVLNATMYAGPDIGAKINTAIRAVGCGIVEVPAGSYTFSTRVTVPQCVTLRGHSDATRLFWHGSGAAIVAANIPAPGQNVQGVVEKFTLTGTSTAGQIGLYQGGDPTNTNAPSTDIGYNYVIRDVTIYNMDKGIYWGNGAFNITWDNVISNNNLTYGWYYPATSNFGGQNNHFYHSDLGGNPSGAFYVSQFPQVTFEMIGMDIEYNGSQSAPGTVVMQGGNYTCIGCHVEQLYGPFVEVGPNNGSAVFLGGIFVLGAYTEIDPQLVVLDAGRATIAMNGVELYLNHVVTNLVTQSGSGNPTVDIRNMTLIDPSYYLKSVTNLTGAGIAWCLPYNNSTGTTAGFCYDGNTSKNAIGTIANGLNPNSFPASGTFMQWNGDGTSGGSDFYNTFSAPSGSAYAFRFNANIGGIFTTLGGIQRNGAIFTNQTPTASTTVSDHSIPIVLNGVTYYMRLSTTP